MKLGSPAICAAVTYLLNECIMSSVFPSALKITLIYNKKEITFRNVITAQSYCECLAMFY